MYSIPRVTSTGSRRFAAVLLALLVLSCPLLSRPRSLFVATIASIPRRSAPISPEPAADQTSTKGVKDLYATGLFSERASVGRGGGGVVITVNENQLGQSRRLRRAIQQGQGGPARGRNLDEVAWRPTARRSSTPTSSESRISIAGLVALPRTLSRPAPFRAAQRQARRRLHDQRRRQDGRQADQLRRQRGVSRVANCAT